MARFEEDSLGPLEIPDDSPYGPETERARRNFPISGRSAPAALLRALLRLKRATATANERCGALPSGIVESIRLAVDELLAPVGEDAAHWRALFPLDLFGAGAGTSLHMNVNEVVAKRANRLRKSGRLRELRTPDQRAQIPTPQGSSLEVDAHDHVNLHQSSNDVFPSAIRMALIEDLGPLLEELSALARSIAARAFEAKDLRKTARTHLRDALPITLGRELHAWSISLDRCKAWIKSARQELAELPIGGGAVGTSFGMPNSFPSLVLEELNRGRAPENRFRAPADRVEAVQSQGPIALAMGMLRLLAIELGRIASDLRLLSSGPGAGLGELVLPPVQPGSSMMPGKVNPSVPEMVNQVCLSVLGQDLTLALAAGAGQLDLNPMTPVMALSALDSTRMLTHATRTLRVRCIDGLSFDAHRMEENYRRNTLMLTGLAPHLGFKKTLELIREAEQSGMPVLDWLRKHSGLSDPLIDSFEVDLRRSLDWPFDGEGGHRKAVHRGPQTASASKRRP